jgi:glucose-6-phosphate dehydrogenase assembly protein OpcA
MDEMNLEELLADALRPVDPPQRMSDRLHDTFSAITDAAASDLSDWAEELTESELDSLRDPRNWVRPVAALAAGGVATGALILVGFRRRSRFRG